MKILYIKLTNFSRVLSGMGKLVVEIDYTKINEPINLLIGNNGTGKTSILKCHHPFAYNSATGDTANNGDLIVEGKDGEKIINIQNGDDIFFIRHIYTRKKDGTLSVKSFIEKNGVELNDNGTSNSFKAVVSEELGVDETFLTLLSIGNSVDGFVEFTSANRKNAASKLFSQLEIYEKYYKDMTALARGMKTLLNNVTSKLSKYSGVNKEELTRKYSEIKRNMNELNASKTAAIQNIGAVQSQLEGMKSVIADCEELQRRLSSAVDEVNYHRGRRKNTYTKEYLEDTLEARREELADRGKDIAVLGGMVENALNMKNGKLQMISNLEDNLSKIVTSEGEEDLVRLQAKLEADLSTIKAKRNGAVAIDVTKSDLITASIYLDQLSNLCNKLIYDTVNESLVPIVLEKYKKNRDIDKILSQKYNEIGNQINRYTLVHSSRVVMKSIDGDCDNKDCPYRQFYEDYMHVMNMSLEQTNAELNEHKEKLSSIEDMMNISTILKSIFDFISTNKVHFNRLPKDVFNINTFIDTFMLDRTIYNKERLVDYIDVLEMEEQQESIKEKLQLTNDKLKHLRDNRDVRISMEQSVSDMRKEIEKLDGDIIFYRAELDQENDICSNIQKDIDEINDELAIINIITDMEDVINGITNELKTKSDEIDKIDTLRNKLAQYNDTRNKLEFQIGELTIESQRIAAILNDMNSLEKEELELKYKYDDVMEIRKAVSPTTGIPVEFIEFYVKSEMIHRVNTLLDSVYHGSLQILGDLVVVDDKEFIIPYKKNNTVVSDISKASDGERAILSIAFSLVLIQLTNENNNSSIFYTIMLLDEIDRPLDHGSRSKFINLIETYMDVIHAEQLFLISHNNMFDSYPVHVIMTSEMNTSNMTQTTVTRLYEGNK